MMQVGLDGKLVICSPSFTVDEEHGPMQLGKNEERPLGFFHT